MNSVASLRVIAIVEGISYVLLVGIAMPLKYLAGIPEAVRVVGMAHGVLFVLFGLALAVVWLRRRWSFPRVAMVGISALIPAATFWMDHRLRQWQGEPLPTSAI
jgi:integral membrane protein